MHLTIPCNGIAYGQSRPMAENLRQQIHELVPAITTIATSINSRGDLINIDTSQNDYSDHIAALYCLRAYHIPTASAPLEWKEVKTGLDPQGCNIKAILTRLKNKGDLWNDVLEKKIALKNRRFLQNI